MLYLWNMAILKNIVLRSQKDLFRTFKKARLYRGDSFQDAVYQRLIAEQEHFGEFAPQKYLYKQYGIEVESLTN